MDLDDNRSQHREYRQSSQVMKNKDYNQLMEHVSILKESTDISLLYNSMKYVMQNISLLNIEEVFDLVQFVLNIALNFSNIDLSCLAIHLLGIILNNPNNGPQFDGISQFFVEKADINYIKTLCMSQFNLSIKNFLISFICFSTETIEISKTSGIFSILLIDRPFFVENVEETLLHLQILMALARRIKDEEVLFGIFNKNMLTLSFTEDFYHKWTVKIFHAIFSDSSSPDLNLIDNFLKNCAPILFQWLHVQSPCQMPNSFHSQSPDQSPNNQNPINYQLNAQMNDPSCEQVLNGQWKALRVSIIEYLNIFEHISYLDDINSLINQYKVFELIMPFKNDDDLEISKVLWSIISNFIYENPMLAIFSIQSNIANEALFIAQEGTIKMKSFVAGYFESLFTSYLEPEIFEFIIESNLVEIAISLIDCIELENACYIVSALSKIFNKENEDIDDDEKNMLLSKCDIISAAEILNTFIETYQNEDLPDEIAQMIDQSGDILEFFDEL